VTAPKPVVYICEVCGRSLDLRSDAEGMALVHTAQDAADHEPVPVPMPEGWTGGRCDFCNGEPPTHVLPARDFAVPGYEEFGESLGDWAACADCAPLIERNQWSALVRRAADAQCALNPFASRAMVERHLTAVYRRLRRNVTGALKEIEE
jgi:hypothetical protein